MKASSTSWTAKDFLRRYGDTMAMTLDELPRPE
jgi:hypothetical protein